MKYLILILISLLNLLLFVNGDDNSTLLIICNDNLVICDTIFSNCDRLYNSEFTSSNVNEYIMCITQMEMCIDFIARHDCPW